MLSFCGIDVSKDHLDIMVLPNEQCFSVRNDEAGWATLLEQLRGRSITAIGIEASGGYERGVVRSLHGATGAMIMTRMPIPAGHISAATHAILISGGVTIAGISRPDSG
jgi:hypothetical protein